jgi:hypothetical protein
MTAAEKAALQLYVQLIWFIRIPGIGIMPLFIKFIYLSNSWDLHNIPGYKTEHIMVEEGRAQGEGQVICTKVKINNPLSHMSC